MSPWPGACTLRAGEDVKLHASGVVDGSAGRRRAGALVVADKSRVLVACGRGRVELVSVQPEGKKAMKGSDWAMGRGVVEGDVLGA